LLGLAFHPDYEQNGKFYVNYTDTGSDTIVECYQVSTTNPDVADPNPVSTIIGPIFQPQANHNGGMIAFGPGGYLYAGVGDGGGGNDPPNNAQNVNLLLGKILRIDVDQADPVVQTPYSSPSDNPYVGQAGRDEIFSIGWRNPWRFSFDRVTGQQWVADVGQGAREEVSTPIENGGNYGWRVYEGSGCTNIDPALCVPASYIFPIFDYTHSGGRCSVTGGYVYQGAQNAVPVGTYLYGDFCSGEIFAWDGATQTVLLDTTMRISSFGEDEQGELYVVNLDGTVSRIVSSTPCGFDIAPTSESFAPSGGDGSVAVSAGCGWSAVANAPWIHVTSDRSGSGNGSVGYRVDPNSSSAARTGTLTIAGRTFTVSQGGTVTCTFSINRLRARFAAGGGGGSVRVTAGVGCGWTAVSNAPWVSIISGASGRGNGTVTYSVASNAGNRRKRIGRATIAGKTLTVVQRR
jgi:hypothetical protein